VKKIDTLAAAQGRLSAQTTLLIKGLGASDTFRSLINALSDVLAFFRNHITAIGVLIKSFIGLGAAIVAYRAGLAASIVIQRAWIFIMGTQITWLKQLTAAEFTNIIATRGAATATNLWAKATNALKVAWATNPIFVILAGVTALVAVISLLARRTNDASDSIKSFDQNLFEQQQKLSTLFNVLDKTAKGTNLYKDTLFEINNIYGKYLPNLLTEASSLSEVAKARGLANEGLTNELNLLAQKEAIAKETEALNNRVTESYKKIAQGGAGTLAQRGLLATSIRSAAAQDDPSVAREQINMLINQFTKDVGITAVDIAKYPQVAAVVQYFRNYADEMIKAYQDFEKKRKDIQLRFPGKQDTKITFDPTSIETFKKGYEEAAKLIKEGQSNLIDAAFEFFKQRQDGTNPTIADWLKSEIDRINAIKDTDITNKTEALRALYIALADATKKEGSDTKNINKTAADSLKERLDLLKQMKGAYDDLTKTLSPEKAAEEINKLFSIPQNNLGVKFTPTLDIASFNAELLKLAEMAKKIDKKLYESILEIIASASSKNVIDGVTKTLDQIDAEIEKLKQENALKEAIFNITGIDRGVVVDDIKFLKDKILEMAASTGDIKFGGTFDELVNNLDKITPALKSKIETLQKYIADKSSSTLLDALKFVYQKLPEGTDLQFDFSNILVELDKVLNQAKIDIENFTNDDVLNGLGKLGVGKEAVKNVADAQINAAIEKAKDEVSKLAASYIKSNMTVQMRNDFKNMSDASIDSIRKISKALDDMMENLRSDNELERLFKVAGINASEFGSILEGLKGTKNIDEFVERIDELGNTIKNAEETAVGVNIGGNIITDEAVTKLTLFQKLLRTLFGEIDSAKKEVKFKGVEKLITDLKKLESSIGNIIDSSANLAEAFGAKMSESGRASLDAIKTTATGIISIIEGASKLASKSISAVEKASVILALVSVAMNIIASIKNAANKSYQEQYEREQQLLDVASKYNIALRQRNELLEQSQIIFGTDKYKESLSYVTQMFRATDALGESLDKLRTSKTTVDVYVKAPQGIILDKAKLIALFPKLFDDGKFNLLEAEQILKESQSLLTDSTRRALEEAVTAMEDYKKALDNLNSYFSSIFGELGGGMMDAIINNLDNTKLALDEFTTYASSALEKLFQDIAYSMYLAPIFTNLQKQITSIYETAKIDKGVDTALAIMDVFETIKPELDSAATMTQKLIQDIREASKKYSYPVFGATEDMKTTTQTIQGVTEDTARRLEGLINAIRETGVLNLNNIKSIVESNSAIRAYSAESLGVLRNIDLNTTEYLRTFKDLVVSGHSRGSTGLKVFVN
jgi:hypothetical protein